MKKKIFSILFALVLAVSLGMVAVPMAGTVEADPGGQYWYWTDTYDMTLWGFIMYKDSGNGASDVDGSLGGWKWFSDEAQVEPGADYSGEWTGNIRVKGVSGGEMFVIYLGVLAADGVTFTSKGSQMIFGMTTSYADYALSIPTTGFVIDNGERIALSISSSEGLWFDVTGSDSPCYIQSPPLAPDYPVSGPPSPPVPMSEFEIDKAGINFGNPGDDEVRLKGTLQLDLDNGDGVNIADDVTVTVGPLSATIDGGSMVEKGKEGEKWEYKRPEDGDGSIEKMTIKWKNGNGKFDITMDKADLTGITNPVTISIQIGDDFGEETILLRVRWDYKGS